MHPLEKYLKKHRLTHKAFAKRVEVTRPTITKIVSRNRTHVGPTLARKISKETKNEVSLQELLFGDSA